MSTALFEHHKYIIVVPVVARAVSRCINSSATYAELLHKHHAQKTHNVNHHAKVLNPNFALGAHFLGALRQRRL